MTDRELNIALREMARSQGLCDQWYNEWKDDSTIEECLERYVRGIDFTVTKDYPPLDFIRKNFSKDVLHKHLIFLDEEIDIEDAQSGIYVFLGDCSGKICFNGFSVGTIHIRHTSIINVCSYDMAKTFVSVYEGATAQCHSFDHATHRLYDKHNK